MKRICYFISALVCFCLLSNLGCKNETIDGGGDEQFMEKLTATVSADGGSITLKSKSCFFGVESVTSIQNGDTIRQNFENINVDLKKSQVISGDWYTLETILEGGNVSSPTAVNISTEANSTDSKRELIIRLWKGDHYNTVTITQAKK